MLFDLSYAPGETTHETLAILASTDCGVTYHEISYNFPERISTAERWVPQTDADWSRNVSVNLNSVAGLENVRIAFVIHSEHSNNLYLDNIEFFVTADPNPIEVGDW